MCCERGQATIEWTGLVLLVSLAFTALLAFGPRVDGRSFGGWLTHEILCAVRGGCGPGDEELAAAYGPDDAELVRRYAPNIAYESGTLTLPVDWRECREHRCSDAPDRPGEDVAYSRTGTRATVFTRLVRKNSATYLQYWFYYPDSVSTVAHAAGAWRKVMDSSPPGTHPDDWEAYVVRIDREGRADVRATAHGHWRYAKGRNDGTRALVSKLPPAVQGRLPCSARHCEQDWGPWTSWTRVSRGSHAGHIPRDGAGERTTSGVRLRLVPLERVDRSEYVPNGDPKPPWEKEAFEDPESGKS
jgi:hypothetical protein